MAQISNRFQFIDVHGGQTKTWINKDQQRRVRIAAMRAYLRDEQDKTERSYSRAKMSPNIHTHISKFRSLPENLIGGSRELQASNGISNATRKRKRSKAKRSSEPADFGYFKIADIDRSQPETRDLLEYYLHGYWSNSYAANPDGEWTKFTLANPAALHATLSLVALHRADRERRALSPAYLWHRGRAIQLVSKRLANDTEITTEGTIGAVALLASSDEHSYWSTQVKNAHIKGLEALMQKRGATESISNNHALRRVLLWVDLLHSAMNETPRALSLSNNAPNPPLLELGMLMEKDPLQRSQQRELIDDLPLAIRKIIRQLRLLSQMKTRLLSNKTRTLCEAFSNLLWETEYDILELEHERKWIASKHLDDPMEFDAQSVFKAVRDAALIFSYWSLRDQNSVVLFTKLTCRLRRYLAAVLSTLLDGVRAITQCETVLLLWMAFIGCKGASLCGDNGRWFLMQAGEAWARYGRDVESVDVEGFIDVGVTNDSSGFGVDEFFTQINGRSLP